MKSLCTSRGHLTTTLLIRHPAIDICDTLRLLLAHHGLTLFPVTSSLRRSDNPTYVCSLSEASFTSTTESTISQMGLPFRRHKSLEAPITPYCSLLPKRYHTMIHRRQSHPGFENNSTRDNASKPSHTVTMTIQNCANQLSVHPFASTRRRRSVRPVLHNLFTASLQAHDGDVTRASPPTELPRVPWRGGLRQNAAGHAASARCRDQDESRVCDAI